MVKTWNKHKLKIFKSGENLKKLYWMYIKSGVNLKNKKCLINIICKIYFYSKTKKKF